MNCWAIGYALYHDDVTKWKHFPHYWRFVRGIHQWLVNSSHKGQWHGALVFSLICAMNKRHHTHYDYDVIVMIASQIGVPYIHIQIHIHIHTHTHTHTHICTHIHTYIYTYKWWASLTFYCHDSFLALLLLKICGLSVHEPESRHLPVWYTIKSLI